MFRICSIRLCEVPVSPRRNVAKAHRRGARPGGGESAAPRPHMAREAPRGPIVETPMNYLLALLLPPLSILLAGRPIVAIVTFLVWVPAIIFSGGLGHPIFVILAWIIIFERRDERRARRQ